MRKREFNKLLNRASYADSKKNKVNIKLNKPRKRNPDQVYNMVKNLLINGSNTKNIGTWSFKDFEGLKENINRREQGKIEIDSSLEICRETFTKNLALRMDQVNEAFRRLNREGWIETTSDRGSHPWSPRGDGWQWKVTRYKVRIENIIKKGLLDAP